MNKSRLWNAIGAGLVVGLAIGLAAPVSAVEQVEAKKTAIYAGAFISVPSSPEFFEDGWLAGFHGMVGYGREVMPSLMIVGKVEYNNFPFHTSKFEADGITGGSRRIYMAGADARYEIGFPSGSANGLFFAGLGVAHLSVYDFADPAAEVDPAAKETKVYFNAGTGLEFKVGKTMMVFLQGGVVSIATSGTSTNFVPLTVGLKF